MKKIRKIKVLFFITIIIAGVICHFIKAQKNMTTIFPEPKNFETIDTTSYQQSAQEITIIK